MHTCLACEPVRTARDIGRLVPLPLSLTLCGDGWASGPTPPQGNHKGPTTPRHHPCPYYDSEPFPRPPCGRPGGGRTHLPHSRKVSGREGSSAFARAYNPCASAKSWVISPSCHVGACSNRACRCCSQWSCSGSSRWRV